MALDADDLKTLKDMITTSLGEGLKPVLGRLDKVEAVETPDHAALIAAALKDFKPEEKKTEDKVDDAAAANTARMVALEAKLLEQTNATKTAAEKADTERMLSALRTQLIAKKIPANRVNHVIASLHNADGRISMKDGAPVIQFDRESAGGKYTDHLALDAGLDEWLGTDDGKAFLPAREVRGADVHNSSRASVVGPKGKVNTSSLISSVLNQAQRR